MVSTRRVPRWPRHASERARAQRVCDAVNASRQLDDTTIVKVAVAYLAIAPASKSPRQLELRLWVSLRAPAAQPGNAREGCGELAPRQQPEMHIHMRSCGVEKYPVPVAVVGIMDHAAEAVSRSPVAVCALCRRTGTACTSTRGSGSARRTGALPYTPHQRAVSTRYPLTELT